MVNKMCLPNDVFLLIDYGSLHIEWHIISQKIQHESIVQN
jgi:hypothetical protein